ncbi:MAG: DNA topoisomerase VI subunit B [Candidatus Latescibacteria bacterium]|nr:DNA topoisomerase VI subunit B [Candidatus Latescibacterota bacterium]
MSQTLSKGSAAKGRSNAQTMAASQREISVSEFFSRNRHLLGFDNPRRALLTSVKEAVDNSLDACEEAGIMPRLEVAISQVAEDRYTMRVQDNGPGIVKRQIPNIFGKLLYGSKFHRLKMSRGQQGIGISAASMYGQLTTGKAARVISRTGANRPAHLYEIQINTARNKPEILRDEEIEWEPDQGTSVEIEMEARYLKGRQSVDEYLRQTALANPHLHVIYTPPSGKPVTYANSTTELPPEPREVKPHPHGIELGVLMKMLQGTPHRTLQGFLTQEFSRVSVRVAKEICDRADLKPNGRPKGIAREETDRLFKAIDKTRLMKPPTDCIVPVGEELLVASLKQSVEAAYYTSTTRPPAVYRGNPFQVEVAMALGGNIEAEGPIALMRFANRVPLLYQQAACATTRSAIGLDWRNYRLSQSSGSLPTGPLVVLIHLASVWVPFTSESKEAIAHYPEIMREIRLALQECGRQIGDHINRQRKAADAARKKSYIEQYIDHIADALQEITGDTQAQKEQLAQNLQGMLERSRS